jgi:hypothetical protein
MSNYDDKVIIANVINIETGEIMDTINDGDKIVHPKEPDDLIYNFNSGRMFVKMYHEVLLSLKKELTPAEGWFLTLLSNYICYQDCCLRRGGRPNGEAFNIKTLASELEYEYPTTRRLVSSLMKKGLLGYFATGSKDKPNAKSLCVKLIVVNPYIFTRGNRVSKSVENLFSDAGWK